jgi:hypothetical protein
MGLESKIYATLTTSATLVAQIGTSIFPDHAVQGAKVPTIVYHRISGTRHNSLTGYVGLENARIQFDIYATAIDKRREITDLLIGALTSSTRFSIVAQESPIDEYDDDIGLYARIIDISIWNRE